MKRFFLLTFIVFCTLLFNNEIKAQTVPYGKGYVINGTIKGENKGFVTLRSYFKDGNERVDTAKIEKGKFYFRAPVSEAIPALMVINGKRGFRIYLEPVTYNIDINPENANQITIKGSKLTDEWVNLTTPLKDEDYDVHLRRLENWVLTNPEHIFCSDIIASYLSYNWGYDELFKTLNTIRKPADNTYHYKKLRIREQGLRGVAIGAKAPNFTLNTPDNKSINFYSYLKGKKFVLIDFWASWCKPCREENPNVVTAWKKYNSKGFDVLGVSLDKDKDAWMRAISNDNLSWTNVSDLKLWENEAAKTYMINSIPANVLVDAKGIIIARNLKGIDLLNKLEELTYSYGFTIKGSIKGINEGRVKMNLLLEDGEKKTLTCDIDNNGEFIFSGYVENPCMAVIELPTKDGDISLFIENSNISISGSRNDLENIRITGSKSNEQFSNILNNCNKSKNPIQCLLQNVQQNPSSIYSPVIISSYLAPYLKVDQMRDLIAKLDKDAKKMYQYKLLTDYLEKNPLTYENYEGKVIDFTLPDSNDIDIRLYDFISEKKYILIDFWASWSNPYIADCKYLVEAYSKYAKNGFEILSVSLDKDRELWTKAIRLNKMSWKNVSDLKQWNSIIVKLYNLETIPQNILIDSKGNIIARNLRGDDLLQTLYKLINN